MTKAVARYNSDTFDERSINEIEASALLGFFWESL